jgi:hypothetical protein
VIKFSVQLSFSSPSPNNFVPIWKSRWEIISKYKSIRKCLTGAIRPAAITVFLFNSSESELGWKSVKLGITNVLRHQCRFSSLFWHDRRVCETEVNFSFAVVSPPFLKSPLSLLRNAILYFPELIWRNGKKIDLAYNLLKY